tara:strand:- start:174 stop:911 length:738 start_codon:yes stop_codon:yes gene_type:complete
MTCNKTVIIIPARLKSSRLKQKLLLKIGNKSIINHTYERACESTITDNVIILVDDDKLFNHCKKFSSNVFLTSKCHQSGTDRIIDFIKSSSSSFENIINLQADEPFIDPTLIDNIILRLKNNHNIVSAAVKASNPKLVNPNNVKVVIDANSNAIYFSRAEIPYNRDNSLEFHKLIHHGIYGYKKNILIDFSNYKNKYLEDIEKLEQLRFLENGQKINMIISSKISVGVDTKEDYLKAIEIYEKYY